MKSEAERPMPSARQAGAGQGDGSAAGARVCGLSSARDRARLREREQAERARVERVLARGPRGIERRRRERDEPVICRVCGGHEVVQDEVSERGSFRLAQCLRCEHRWTERGPAAREWRVIRSTYPGLAPSERWPGIVKSAANMK